MNEMSKYVNLELDEYKDLIIRADRLRVLIEIIYKATDYDPYEGGLRISNVKGERILRYLDLIDCDYQRELRRKEEEYKRKQEEEYKERVSKQVNKK